MKRKTKKNENSKGKFFFTELGWKKYGKIALARCKQQGEKVRIIRVKYKQKAISKDKYQVVAIVKRGKK